MHQVDTTRAATDVDEFVTDLDGGQFSHLMSIALSEVAAAVVDRSRKGEVSLAFKFERIAGTHQVRVAHTVKYTTPTSTGTRTEDSSGETVLHVGKFGKLSLASPELPGMGQPTRQDKIPD